jgi:hypothetical protein
VPGTNPDIQPTSELRERKHRMKRNAALSVVILLLVCLASSAAFAQKGTILRVVVVKTDNPAAYAQELEKGKQIMKSLGIQATTRVWQARYAGPEAGAMVASIEYPSMDAFADAFKKTSTSPEYMAWIKDLDKIRKIVSDSLYTEW